VKLDLAVIAGRVAQTALPESLLLVEGIGGLLCPLTDSETVADLAAMLRFPLVVVARRSLGTLNHTLLTLEVARKRGLPVAGIVVNETSPVRSCAEETNVEELSKRIAVPLLAVVPYLTNPYDGEIASLAAVDWQRLASG
jgi:dethiobiotin synthetase